MGTVEGAATGDVSEQRPVSIITIENGQIVQFTDYWSLLAPLGVVQGRRWWATSHKLAISRNRATVATE